MKIINNISDLEKHIKTKKSTNNDFKINDETDANFNFNTNKANPLNEAKFDIQALKEIDRCKTRLLKYITYKKRTKEEVKNKFSKEFDEELLDNVINELEEKGYINDDDYIKRSINEFMAIKTLSIKEIKYKLISKGIKTKKIDDYIDKHCDEMNQYEKKSAKKIAIKKQNLDNIQIKQYLLKKGYKTENINNAIENLEKENYKREI